jgi:uncharacterized protein YndB with AHSA1/START domain
MYEQVETYEHLGGIQIYCIDLHTRYKAIIESRCVFLSPEEADYTFTFDFQSPPPVIWHWWTDTEKKTLWSYGEAVFTARSRPGGRSGPGATNHCAHGKDLKGSLVETILDWRPFDYFTLEGEEGKLITRQTIKLEPIANGTGTRLHIMSLMVSPPIPRFIRRPILKMMMSKMFLKNCETVANCITQETDLEIGPQASQMVA